MVDDETLMFGISNAFGDLDEHRISDFKEGKNSFFSSVGYCTRYTEPFKILFEGFFYHFQTEEERLEAEQHNRETFKLEQCVICLEELSINDFKTFKLEQCVICLEELSFNGSKTFKSNQCVSCLEKENTILRIIE